LGAKLDREEDSTQLWIEVLMRCFVGGPITSATCIGITRGLTTGIGVTFAGGFGSLVECARSWLVRMGSGRLPSLVLADEFGNLGTNTDCGSY